MYFICMYIIYHIQQCFYLDLSCSSPGTDASLSLSELNYFLRILLLNPLPLHVDPPAEENFYIVEALGEEEEEPCVQRRR